MATAPPPPDWSGQQQAVAPLGRPGGFWIRFVAYIIDALIVGTAAGVLLAVFGGIAAVAGKTPGGDLPPAVIGIAVLMFLGYVVGVWLYEALLTSSERGGTLGKRAMGLRVVRADGTRLSFGRSTARYFLKIIVTPMIPLGLGYIMAGFSSGKRALHDLMADTLVIRV